MTKNSKAVATSAPHARLDDEVSPLVIAVAVTYNPDIRALSRLLASLTPQVGRVIVVDNGSGNCEQVRLEVEQGGGTFIELGENRGIAAAQNRGVISARQFGATHVLLSDQDSLPAPNMVQKLLQCLESPGPGAPVAAVGPVPLDGRGAASEALVYSFTTWGPKRRTVPPPGQRLEVPFVLASGCLIPIQVLDRVGPMDEPLFIDHVDLAWCLRAIEAGYRILVCGAAILEHSLGDEVAQIPGRGRPVHVHSPVRNYYMMRNTLFLQRAPFMPWRWKAGYLLWMVKYFGYYLLLAPGRAQRLPYLWRAITDGMGGRGGSAS